MKYGMNDNPMHTADTAQGKSLVSVNQGPDHCFPHTGQKQSNPGAQVCQIQDAAIDQALGKVSGTNGLQENTLVADSGRKNRGQTGHGSALAGAIRLFSGVVLVGLVTTTSAASAADFDDVNDVYDWTGFYLGVGGGYFDFDDKISDPVGGVFPSFSTGTDGGMIGGYLGYNYQIQQLVIGLDADVYYLSGGKTKLAGLPVPSTLKKKEGASWAIRGKLGYAMGPFMAYVAGGYAGLVDQKSFAAGYVGSQSETLHGWTIGGGAEYMVTPDWLVRLDYQYKDFSEKVFFASGPPPSIASDAKLNQITLGVSYKF